jgi:hypothetical protein
VKLTIIPVWCIVFFIIFNSGNAIGQNSFRSDDSVKLPGIESALLFNILADCKPMTVPDSIRRYLDSEGIMVPTNMFIVELYLNHDRVIRSSRVYRVERVEGKQGSQVALGRRYLLEYVKEYFESLKNVCHLLPPDESVSPTSRRRIYRRGEVLMVRMLLEVKESGYDLFGHLLTVPVEVFYK